MLEIVFVSRNEIKMWKISVQEGIIVPVVILPTNTVTLQQMCFIITVGVVCMESCQSK